MDLSDINPFVAIIALVTSLAALFWNIIRDLIRDRVNISCDVRIGKSMPIGGEERRLFIAFPELPSNTSSLNVLFTITNIGRRDVMIDKIGGEYTKRVPGKPAFHWITRHLPRLLRPYEVHTEYSDDIELLRDLTEGRIRSMYALDTKGRRWCVSSRNMSDVVTTYKLWSRTKTTI